MIACVACLACLAATETQAQRTRTKKAVKQTAKVKSATGTVAQRTVKKAQLPNDTIVVNGVTFEMVHVAGGTFTMGRLPERDGDPADDDPIMYQQFIAPAHRVTLGDYCIGKTEVTQALWKAVMGSFHTPNQIGDNLPVENVSWEQCQAFINKLNALTGKKFRFLTEAEWEYAARGGNKSKGYKFSGSNNINEVAWYYGNSGGDLHPVGTKAPNELGIHDMTGNVREWCADWREDYSLKPQTNPLGAKSGDWRVVRGGGFSAFPAHSRISVRGGICPIHRDAITGLRLAY